MGNKVDFIEQLRLRIENAFGAGNPLEDVKRLRIGSKEEARKSNDFPIINLRLTGGTEENVSAKGGTVDDMAIEISLLVNKIDSDSNTLYKTSDSTGFLFLLENLLNVLDENISGNLDLGYNNTIDELRIQSYSIEESNENLIDCVISLNAKTRQFVAGQR